MHYSQLILSLGQLRRTLTHVNKKCTEWSHPNQCTESIYDMPTKANCTPKANNAYRVKTMGELATSYGGAIGWPVKQTWIKAINRGSCASWPDLTAAMVNKYHEVQELTVMGHMYACRSGIRSTQPAPP